MKKLLSLTRLFVCLCVVLSGTSAFAASFTKVANDKNPAGYYLVGTMTNWALSTDYLLTKNTESATDEYVIENVALKAKDQFKVLYSEDGYSKTTWYPSGEGNNYGENGEITKDGTYTISCRPKGDGGKDWFHNCLFVATMNVQNENAKLASLGYGTYYNSSYDVTLPAGVVAYIVTGVNNDKLTYEMIADGSGSPKTVPAGTAVLLYSAPAKAGGATDVTLTLTPSSAKGSPFDNLLRGSDTKATTTGGAKYYKLTYGNDNITFGWFWGADGGAAFTSPAYKAWLALPAAAAGARVFLGLPDEEDATGIATIKDKQQKANNVWYDLNGRCVNTPMKKGVYVKEGRKMVIK